MIAFPDYVTGVEMNENKACLVMKSGMHILYDDEKKKTFDEKSTMQIFRICSGHRILTSVSEFIARIDKSLG